MSGAKHTPGPWFIKYNTRAHSMQIIAPNESDNAPGAVGTAITRWGSISLPSSDEGKANARLIAAAPDLLAALEKLEYWLDSDAEVLAAMNALERDDHLAKLAMVRAAIAKAKGAAL